MYAQVVETATAPERRSELDRLVRERLLPMLRAETGFAGAVSLVDHVTGEAIVLVFWETKEQAARPLSRDALTFLSTVADGERLAVGNRQDVSVWEVDARV